MMPSTWQLPVSALRAAELQVGLREVEGESGKHILVTKNRIL